MRKIALNPKSLSIIQAQVMQWLLTRYPNDQIFYNNIDYKLKDDVYLSLSHKIIKHEVEDIFYIIENEKLGDSQKSQVFPSKGYFQLPMNKLEAVKYTQLESELIVKIEKITIQRYAHSKPNEVENYFRQSKLHEYEFSKNGHLMAQKPVFVNPMLCKHSPTHYEVACAMVMNKMPGFELLDLVNYMMAENNISPQITLNLSLELLRVFKEQVLDKRWSHGDLKPENIIINFKNDQSLQHLGKNGNLSNKSYLPDWQMNIIDFAGCAVFGQKRKFANGTIEYAAPEVIQSVENHQLTDSSVNDEKVDMYSLGVILALIGGMLPEDVNRLQNADDKEKIHNMLLNYFSTQDMPLFIEEYLPTFIAAVANMTHPDAALRWSYAQTLAFYTSLNDKYWSMFNASTVQSQTVSLQNTPDNEHPSPNGVNMIFAENKSPVSFDNNNDDTIIFNKKLRYTNIQPSLCSNEPATYNNQANNQANNQNTPEVNSFSCSSCCQS